jgi:lipopolysaccharide/colanic/teichoic acid biosynthesis glycosyltransferase
MDAYYVKRSSAWFDIKILFQSFGVVLFRKGNKDNK